MASTDPNPKGNAAMTHIRGGLNNPAIGGALVPAAGGRVVAVTRTDWRSQGQAPVPTFRSLVPAPSPTVGEVGKVAMNGGLVHLTDAVALVQRGTGTGGRYTARIGTEAYQTAQGLGTSGPARRVHVQL